MSKKGTSAVAEKVAAEEVATVENAGAEAIGEVQETIAAEAVTSETAAPIVEKKPKNKPNETTRTIEKFADDTKGIRPGTKVSFNESNKPEAKVITGTVQRIFDFWLKPERQEAKIKGDNGNRYYRFEKQLTVIVAEAVATEEVAAS